ncbi:hypothetical protein HMH01_02295 [Halovulum dunhuangense]|uniref:PIN domain-containing protein n=1 Tax=Halovulum dunhuangense TaxID=1505036 RepID=A0A849KV64_9RHOB|nr:hypothetical protein [Halovulum dunhuangense]NNU79258.1 hypothetical protein [Halovulum dunhuangense]
MKLTIYLDQNILGSLRQGQPEKEELERALERFREFGAAFVYSDVHVEECRAFYEPAQYVRILNDLNGYHLQPKGRLAQHREAKPNMAEELILGEIDFATKCLGLLHGQMVLLQYVLGWLGEFEAEELMRELEEDIALWAEEAERETLGLLTAASARQQLLEPLISIDLKKLKREGMEQQPQTAHEWNIRYGKIDKLDPDKVVDFIFSEAGDEAAQYLSEMFPKGTWPTGAYQEHGALTGLLFLLFCQGVGRDPAVKKGSQSDRRKRLRAQFRDCRHIEEAAGCDLFLSQDAGAIKLAQAAYAHAGVRTIVKKVTVLPN